MLSQYFTEEEFTRSATAHKHGIDNSLPLQFRRNAAWFCKNVLDPIRNYLGRPVIINSGYRSEKLNQMLGSKPTSFHMRGLAADIRVPNMTAFDLAKEIMDSGIAYDKLILEKHGSREWVHIQAYPTNRKRTITLVINNGRASTREGLFA